MRVLVVAAMVAGCGAKAAPESGVRNVWLAPKGLRPTPHAVLVRQPRPELDLSWLEPDFHNELRWPLTGMNHPTLEPRFPVASELAVGVDWQQLCARGVQNRVSSTQRETLAYLHGWCDVMNRDIDAACTHLTPLLGSVTSGIRAAVRQDLANILVNDGDADKAEHWLSKHNIRDIGTLDLLAANYVEVGSATDALTITRRAIDADDHASDATKCYRLVRRIAIGLGQQPTLAIQELKSIATKPNAPDETCERLWHKVSCSNDHRRCVAFFKDENLDVPSQLLADAYYAWPSDEASWEQWTTYAAKARSALGAPGAAELLVTALETAVRARGTCPEGDLALVVHHSIELVRNYPHDEHEARLQELERVCPKPPSLPSGAKTAGSATNAPSAGSATTTPAAGSGSATNPPGSGSATAP